MSSDMLSYLADVEELSVQLMKAARRGEYDDIVRHTEKLNYTVEKIRSLKRKARKN